MGDGPRKAAVGRRVAGAGEEALTLFAADKVSRVRELRRETAISAESRMRGARARRLRHYQRSLAMLQERLPGSPLVQDLRRELAGFLREGPVLAGAH